MLGQPARAFTLVELIIVLVLLAIISLGSYVAIGSFRYQQLRATAEKVASDLKYAKNLALASNIWHGVVFDEGIGSYSVYQTDGTTDTLLKRVEDVTRDFQIVLPDEFSGIAIANVDIDGGGKVEFNPYGEPYLDKTSGIPLSANATITLSGGNYTETIIIEPVTGRIYFQ